MNVGSLYLHPKKNIMPRPVHSRKIEGPPRMMGYKPFGMEKCRMGSVNLKLEEFESIRLAIYETCSQEEAAKSMNVSRPTFTRIYNRALKAIAQALIEGRCLEIDGGDFLTDKEWYRCNKCNKIIEGKDNHTRCVNCKSFSINELVRISNKSENKY